MPTYGKLSEFDPEKSSWSSYVDRLEQYFLANGIEEEATQKAIFLTELGDVGYGKLCDLMVPVKPSTKAYSELIALLTKEYQPKQRQVVQRFRFHKRDRNVDESVATFVTELRKLAASCNFNQAVLNESLCDRFVCGINDEVMQKRLLEEDTLTLDKAVSLSEAIEAIRRDTLRLKSCQVEEPEQVHAVNVQRKDQAPGHSRNESKATGYQHSDGKGLQSHNQFPHMRSIRTQALCYRCTSANHTGRDSPHIGSTCYRCGKMGHIGKACRSPNQNLRQQFNRNQARTSHVHHEVAEFQPEYHLNHIRDVESAIAGGRVPPPCFGEFRINGVNVSLELDSGSPFTLVSEEVFGRFSPRPELEEFAVKLSSFSGHPIVILGRAKVLVQYKTRTLPLHVVVVKRGDHNICGREWIFSGLQIMQISADQVRVAPSLDEVLKKHAFVFSAGAGLLANVKVHLHKKHDAIPRFFKARAVPYAMTERVEKELARLEGEGIITSIPHSEFAAPIVPVVKPSGAIRICGDFKQTANPAIDTEKYPLPRAQDIFASLAGGRYFSRLDMREAYSQLELDEESRKLVVINTSKGLYQYNRLPYGVSSASAVFQRHIETVLQDVSKTSPFQDDVLVGGTTKEDAIAKLDQVLTRFKEAGLKLHLGKCVFLQTKLDFLGYTLDTDGLRPQSGKMKAVMEAPAPKNVEELRSYLGLLNYYASFIPNNATQLAPLYRLLQKATKWAWTKVEDSAFQASKQALVASDLLVHFNRGLDVYLACDASPVGIGAVISHVVDGQEKPIAFASRTLTTTEQNYPQIEREALSIIFGVTKFREYLLD